MHLFLVHFWYSASRLLRRPSNSSTCHYLGCCPRRSSSDVSWTYSLLRSSSLSTYCFSGWHKGIFIFIIWISRYRMRALHVTGVYFYKHFALVQSELSSNFCTNYPVIKNYLVSFFVKKTSSCQFQNKKRFCFSNKSSSGEISCPYKSAILWRHIFDWHEIGARILYLLILWFTLVS